MASSDPLDTRWLSAAEVARRLALTPLTVHGFIDRREMAASRMGRMIPLQQFDLEALIDACRIVPGTLGVGAG